MSDGPGFKQMYRQLKSNIKDEPNTLYLIHTPLGVIDIGKLDYRIDGFVIVIGQDENKQKRVAVFADDVLCSYPLEVIPKDANVRKTIGFKGQSKT